MSNGFRTPWRGAGRFARIGSAALLALASLAAHATDTQPPTAPADLIAVAYSDTQIKLSWTASTDDTGVTGYQIERCTGDSCTPAPPALTTTTATYYANTGLAAATSYRYRVRAVDAAGNTSAYSGVASAATSPTAAGVIGFTVWNASVLESVGTASILVRRSGGSAGAVSVTCTSGADPPASNAAQPVTDFVSTSVTLSWADGDTADKSCNVPIVDDSTAEPTEYFYLNLTSPTGGATLGSHTTFFGVNILDDDSGTANAITLVSNPVTVTESVGTAAIRLRRLGGSSGAVSITCTAIGDTARPGSDFQATSTVISWASGDAADKFCNIPILNDSIPELVEDFYVSLSAPTGGAQIGPMPSLQVNIVDDDAIGDTQAPTAPSGLTATVASASQINLSWTAATDNVGVTGYRVERCTPVGCGSFTQVGTPTTTIYSDTGLAAATGYTYRIRATDAAGNLGAYSSIASATTNPGADTTAPSAPASLTATATSASQVTLSWTAATDNVGVTGYRVERCAGNGCSGFTQVAAPAATTLTDTGLSAATSYSYRVRATDAAGNLGPYSATATATTASAAGSAGVISFARNNVSFLESVGIAQVVLRRSGGTSGAVSVTCVTGADPPASNTAQPGTDFQSTTMTVSWANGDSADKTCNIPIINDTVAEPSEYFYLNLLSPTGGATLGSNTTFFGVTILDDDAGTSQLTFLSPPTVTESVGTVSIPVRRLGSSSGAVSVTCMSIGDTAQAGSDFQMTTVVLSWASGDMADKTCNIPIINDTVAETVESFYATLSSPTGGASVGPMASVDVQITDDDGGSDTQAPTPPTGLAASVVSGTQVNLTWSASTDDTGVTAYLVERCQGAGCTGFAQVASVTSTAFADAGLTAAVTYQYRVRAQDAAGNLSGYSGVAAATTTPAADTQPPTAPTNLVAAPGTTTMALSWSASTDNVGVAGYRIERCAGSGCSTFVQVGTSTGTSYADSGLVAGVTYGYRVRAFDAAGNLSAYSGGGTGVMANCD